MSEQRGNLYLLTGVLIGIVLGLLYAWVISPVKYTGIDPAALDDSHKDAYRRTIALAYQANGSLDRAQQRLALLNEQDSTRILAAQAQRMLAENNPPEEARAVAILAADLMRPQNAIVSTPAPETAARLTETSLFTRTESTTASSTSPTSATLETVAALQTPTSPPPTSTATATRTLQPTFTPRPTATPLPVLDAPFILKEKNEICDGTIQEGLVRITVTGSDGTPLPGVPITVVWQDKQDVFYTGLIPENGAGYADFLMESGVTYTLSVGTVNDLLEMLSIPECDGGLDISFEQKNQ